jgi:hypothetical protein
MRYVLRDGKILISERQFSVLGSQFSVKDKSNRKGLPRISRICADLDWELANRVPGELLLILWLSGL